jgi:hypothetical protein
MQRFKPAGEVGRSFQEAFFIFTGLKEFRSMSTVRQAKDDVPLRPEKPP